MRAIRFAQALALVLAIAASGRHAVAATECTADVRVTPKSDQITDEAIIKVFAVEVDTAVTCAKVTVDVVLTERLFNGEEITVTRRGWRKVSGSGITFKVNHRMAKDSTLKDWKFSVVSCVECGTE